MADSKTKTRGYLFLLVLVALLSAGKLSFAQNQPGAPLELPGQTQKDSLAYEKSNTDEWRNEQVKIKYRYLHSDKVHHPDTSIHTFHRRPFLQPWYIDLGNTGTSARSLYFMPEERYNPTLGYNTFDIYRMVPDSLKFYNTTAPYSLFSFNLGSKLEQRLHVLHTQNIKPNWNFSIQYRKTTSQGYFLLQRTSHDNAGFTTNYESINKRYKLNIGFTYNKAQQDENGGIADEEQLADETYNDRSTVDVNYNNAVSPGSGAIPRSMIRNVVRDYNLLLQHSYSWGSRDTTYSDDSTKMSIAYTPRFSISHEFRLSNQQLTYKDLAPDSLRYVPFFAQNFDQEGADSVFTRQKQNTIDNALLLNGFLGKKDNQVRFSAGAGVRIDDFSTRFLVAMQSNTIVSNYLTGTLQKEALEQGQWFYRAHAKFYVTGAQAGNSLIQASAGKEFGNNTGTVEAGVQQNINSAPYNYTTYYNQFDTITNTFGKESITRLYARFSSERYGLQAGVNNYLVGNYLYMNEQQLPDQYATAFNLTQLSLRKVFRWRGFVSDNELVYQVQPANAPLNLPPLMGRFQLSYESAIFRNALDIATGVQARYYSPYHPAAYSPIYNRYYYQDDYFLWNNPVWSAFFNFKVKRFRAYIMGDQLQQLFYPVNFINTAGYPAQNAMIRFGFDWVLLR